MKILNITNGDSTVSIMQKAGVTGEILPWRDVLHDGPVPAGMNLAQLSRVRSRFIADRGWGDGDKLLADFLLRDQTLISCDQFDKVILWFEHDLYDQLQILQILDWFAREAPTALRDRILLSMICSDHYLGLCSPKQLTDLATSEEPITPDQIALASETWQAFCADSPIQLAALLLMDLSPLPFLEEAILRLLEEYPSYQNGLSRTALQALTIIAEGEALPQPTFAQNQTLEERVFLGDLSFWIILNEMIECTPALLTTSDQKLVCPASANASTQHLAITTAGQAVLNGDLHFLDCQPAQRWIGGVHLRPGNYWCWCEDEATLIKRK